MGFHELPPSAGAPLAGARQGTRSNAVDYEQGGIGLQDTSRGLLYQSWRFRAVGNQIWIKPENGEDMILLERPSEISQVSGTFDQNMNVVVAFVDSEGSHIRWYDPVSEAFVITTLPVGSRTPRVSLDRKWDRQTSVSDVLLFYVLGGRIKKRVQRERYGAEHDVYPGPCEGIVKVGMGNDYRFKIEMRNQLPDFDPLLLPGIFQYHRASDLEQEIGTEVSFWPDISGNGHNLQVPSGVGLVGPKLKVDDKTGQKYVESRSGASLQILGEGFTDSVDSNTGHTIFVILRSTRQGHVPNNWLFVNGRAVFGFRGDGQHLSFARNPSPARRVFSSSEINPLSTNAFVVTVQGDDQPRLWMNGIIKEPLTTEARWTAYDLAAVFTEGNFNGDLYELALFDRVLDPSEILKLMKYAEEKFNISDRPVPAIIDGAFHHLRADTLDLEDGDLVREWIDFTGLGRDMLASGGVSPIYRESSGDIPYVEFSPTSSGFPFRRDGFPTNGSHTLFIAGRTVFGEVGGSEIPYKAGRGVFAYSESTGNLSFAVQNAGALSSQRTFSTESITDGKDFFGIVTKELNREASLWLNGIKLQSLPEVAWWANFASCIGRNYSGRIYEIILFDRILSEPEIQTLIDYASEKYDT